MDCFDSTLISKYTGYTFYTHKLGKFYRTFRLKTLVTQTRNNYYYKLSFISRHAFILCFLLSLKVCSKTYTIKIIDS